MSDLLSDVASGQLIGDRKRQEDALVTQFPEGDQLGLAILSDGMGGHDDGDLASRILVSEMFAELYLAAARPQGKDTSTGFRAALDSANARLNQHIKAGCISGDTGGTLLAVRIAKDGLRWLSVGDSPLYLFRDGILQRLNDLHSMAAQLDLLVSQGAMELEAARDHPHRHCLTSAVTGQAVPRIDCPDAALPLQPDDLLILASDGLNVLPDERIADLLARHAPEGSTAVTRALLAAVRDKQAPRQDNTSLVVIRLTPARCRVQARALPAVQPVIAALRHRLRSFPLPGLRTANRRAGP
ncbi:PP2C family protein-serine/threonine phosphatase [Mameliella sediminis]|uniref:PP2C family protein-serine/threonine phosphatase n=1 Tax=Mameliella sediminis TaxID=2836866 RepID=UPI001C472A31|nr:protein phosphatase 2C domain-containing protein [Mameliella sediminis]MBV7396958.1 protein phosphatase 2C domain-containing protein [Mameliella sediminis]